MPLRISPPSWDIVGGLGRRRSDPLGALDLPRPSMRALPLREVTRARRAGDGQRCKSAPHAAGDVGQALRCVPRGVPVVDVIGAVGRRPAEVNVARPRSQAFLPPVLSAAPCTAPSMRERCKQPRNNVLVRLMGWGRPWVAAAHVLVPAYGPAAAQRTASTNVGVAPQPMKSPQPKQPMGWVNGSRDIAAASVLAAFQGLDGWSQFLVLPQPMETRHPITSPRSMRSLRTM